MAWRQMDHGHRRFMGLTHFDRATQIIRQHGQAFGQQLVDQRLVHAGTRHKLVDHHTFHDQRLMMVSLQLGHLRDDVIKRLTGKAVAIKWNQHAVGGDQCAEGIEIQGRRRIDINALVILGKLHQQAAQLIDLEF
ncbi:hypothetical protein D3C84_938840 [compost metagenome]